MTRVVSAIHRAAEGCGESTIVFRDLIAMMILNIAVEVGFVDGIIAATTPRGLDDLDNRFRYPRQHRRFSGHGNSSRRLQPQIGFSLAYPRPSESRLFVSKQAEASRFSECDFRHRFADRVDLRLIEFRDSLKGTVSSFNRVPCLLLCD